jgi:hypothetical protein
MKTLEMVVADRLKSNRTFAILQSGQEHSSSRFSRFLVSSKTNENMQINTANHNGPLSFNQHAVL